MKLRKMPFFKMAFETTQLTELAPTVNSIETNQAWPLEVSTYQGI